MGTNKALISIGGRPMIELAANALRRVFTEICVVADEAAPYRFLRLPVLADRFTDCGPLAGIHAGLARPSRGGVFVLPCDTPFITPDLIQFLLNRRAGAPATVARLGQRVHPLCGIYEHRALSSMEAALRAQRLKLTDFLDAIGASIVDITPDLPFFRPGLLDNINDPNDVARTAAPGH